MDKNKRVLSFQGKGVDVIVKVMIELVVQFCYTIKLIDR